MPVKSATLKPKTSTEHGGRHYGIAEHQDGEHVCHVPYRTVKEGENIAGQNVAIVGKDGSFEMLTPGTRPCAGPVQVATEHYRRGWEKTFGARGGVS
jgi:hypothetical protein